MTKHVTPDQKRQTYKIFFPLELKAEQVATFLNDTHGSMHRRSGLFNLPGHVPSLVYEVFGTSQSIGHWLKVPWEYEEEIVPPLRTHIPGIKLVPNGSLPEDER